MCGSTPKHTTYLVNRYSILGVIPAVIPPIVVSNRAYSCSKAACSTTCSRYFSRRTPSFLEEGVSWPYVITRNAENSGCFLWWPRRAVPLQYDLILRRCGVVTAMFTIRIRFLPTYLNAKWSALWYLHLHAHLILWGCSLSHLPS
jgi:hypothetical protein